MSRSITSPGRSPDLATETRRHGERKQTTTGHRGHRGQHREHRERKTERTENRNRELKTEGRTTEKGTENRENRLRTGQGEGRSHGSRFIAVDAVLCVRPSSIRSSLR